MTIIHFITHPEVIIDPATPVPDWRLSPVGIRRMQLAARQPWITAVGTLFCSAERKAREAAEVLAPHVGLISAVIAALGENDRSSTGFLPKAEFEATADEFFARPEESIRGWECAIDAQRRIVRTVNQVIAMPKSMGDIAIVSHGGVGALLLCHLKRVPISRGEDQPGDGGGNFFSFDAKDHRLLSGWRRIED